MIKRSVFAFVAGGLLLAALPQLSAAQAPPADTASEAQQRAAAEARAKALEASLHPQMGVIVLPQAKARLNLADRYYFLGADDAKRVLVEGWGNPPEAAEGVLGLVFTKGKTFRDETWGAVVAYETTGHIKDEDASKQDYASVLQSMKDATEEQNPQRVEKGFGAMHVIGWAQPPNYDAASKTLIWARDLRFEGSQPDTLNYDVRSLGRDGVLSLNMVDVMPNLGHVREDAKGLGATVAFDSGARYADFNPKTDKLADYGLAGLVAAGAGVVLAKKAGLIGLILLFAKKGIVIVVAAAAALSGWFKRRFGRKPVAEAPPEANDEAL